MHEPIDDWIQNEERVDRLTAAGCVIEFVEDDFVILLVKPYDWAEEDNHDQNAL